MIAVYRAYRKNHTSNSRREGTCQAKSSDSIPVVQKANQTRTKPQATKDNTAVVFVFPLSIVLAGLRAYEDKYFLSSCFWFGFAYLKSKTL